MMGDAKNRKLVVVQLSGGNDYLNCVVPYTDPRYIDNRPNVRLSGRRHHSPGQRLRPQPVHAAPSRTCTTTARWPSSTASATRSRAARTSAPWTSGTPRSRRRWGDKGWLGQAIREMTPAGDNVVIAVNFAAALPRALVTLGAPVASVTDLDSYGLLNHIDAAPQRSQALGRLSRHLQPRHRQRGR